MTHTYGYLEWDEEDEQFVDATYSVVNNNNDQEDFAGSADTEECNVCCRDGQYKVEDPDDDSIVQDQLFGFSDTDQPDNSNNIDKICRLKRIDGIYRVVKPWKLVGFNVIPASYFDADQTSNSASNITAYSTYVETVVRNVLGVNASALGVIDAETDLAGTDYTVDTSFSAIPGADAGYAVAVGGDGLLDHRKIEQGSSDNDKRTIQARAIYLDLPPTGYLVNSGGTDYTATNVPLERIPFYETNVTSLVGWIPDEDQVAFDVATNYTEEHDPALQGGSVRDACKSSNVSNSSGNCVSNQQLTNKSFGDFERGEFHPYVVQTDTVTARVYTGNDGLTDVTVNSESTIDASVSITVVP